jgi:hypothetical protein
LENSKNFANCMNCDLIYFSQIFYSGQPRQFWKEISQVRGLDKSFINKYIGYISFKCLARFQNLDQALITKYYKNYSFLILEHQKLTIEFITANVKTNSEWNCLSRNKYLGLEFIEQYVDKLNWNELVQTIKFPEWFITKHLSKMRLKHIFKFQSISESFIEKYGQNHMHIWSRYQNLSFEFVKQRKNVIDWENIYQNLNTEITCEILNLTTISGKHLSILFENRSLPESFVEYQLTRKELDIYFIVKTQKHLSPSFYSKCLKNIDTFYTTFMVTHELTMNPNIPDSFFQKNYKTFRYVHSLIRINRPDSNIKYY